jgi:L-serine dehydratase
MENSLSARDNVSSPSNSEFTRVGSAVCAELDRYPLGFDDLTRVGLELELSPPILGAYLETAYVRRRDQVAVEVEEIWAKASDKLQSIMFNAVRKGMEGHNPLQVLNGNWARVLSGHQSILGAGWPAFTAAIGVQEFNAGMGLIAAAPTGGASGTVPGTIWAVADAVQAPEHVQVQALFVAGLLGLIAFRRGPVSGAQAGCGGEIGVAAGMAGGAAAWLFGGSWKEIGTAASLAATNFVGIECSPVRGFVEYPCVPRNGFAALCAIAAGEAACTGIRLPYNVDDTFDRIFGVGQILPKELRETEGGEWMGTFMEGKK